MTDSSGRNVRQAVPFFWVVDIERSIQFYVDGLGFAVTKRWVDRGKLRWCWLELDQVSLMLQEFWRDGPHTNRPDGKLGSGVSICFMCDDAIGLWRGFVARRLSPKRPFVGNGLWVTEISDPDGYLLMFESPTDQPEETVLAEDESEARNP